MNIRKFLWVGFLMMLPVLSLHATAGDPEIIAEVHGQNITKDDLYKALGADLFEMKKRVYDLKMRKVDELVGQIVLEKEAKKKKIIVPVLLEKYVNKRVKKITKKDIKKFYGENKASLKGSQEQYGDRIRSFLKQERYRKAYTKYIARLKKRARVKTHLTKPERFKVNLSLTPAPFKGKKNAKVQIIEFSDFECPFCSRATKTLNKVFKKYKRKINVTFKAFPLSRHKDSPLAHQASLCAQDQNKFWPYHDTLFDNQKNIKRPDLEKYAKKHKLNMDKFRQCLDSGEKFAKVQKEIAEGEQAGVKSTPTFFINGQMIVGAVTQEALEEIIKEELKKKN